jgi:hypothetical protein
VLWLCTRKRPIIVAKLDRRSLTHVNMRTSAAGSTAWRSSPGCGSERFWRSPEVDDTGQRTRPPRPGQGHHTEQRARRYCRNAQATPWVQRGAQQATGDYGSRLGQGEEGKCALETDWKVFATSVQDYFNPTREQSERRGWPSSAQSPRRRARVATCDRRTPRDCRWTRGRAKGSGRNSYGAHEGGADAAKAEPDTLSCAGTESWSACKAARAETSAAFDRADKAAQHAFNWAA